MQEPVAAPLQNGCDELLRVLGQGGVATAYLAGDSVLQVDRAIKMLAPELSRLRSIRERFVLEARSMAATSAPNVAKVFEIGQDGDRVFLVMEVVAGAGLMDLVATNGPPPRSAVDLVALVLPVISGGL